MKPEELKHLKIDRKYEFTLTDGRKIIKRGSWLLGAKGGHYAIDERKCEHIESVQEHN